MKAVDIFGYKLMPFFVWWKRQSNLTSHNFRMWDQCQWEEVLNLEKDAHDFLSRPIDISYFVRPEEPKEEDYKEYDEFDRYIFHSRGFQEAYKKYQNWRPLFQGEWEVKHLHKIYDGISPTVILNGERIAFLGESKFKTLNDFATHCYNSGIELKLDKEYEI